ncbi:hypothetical protein ABBQ32_003004 [Trebouxia sp. C0010 RCD-2024]
MQYFRSYLKRVLPAQDAEISVQCDVAVFSWLLQYAKAFAAGQQLPALSTANCMPVLISSDFLQMEELKSNALAFIALNFTAVANLSHDLAGLADSLLTRLIDELRQKECSWREIFWKLWGLAHVLLCCTCLGHFPAADLPLCRHHPQGPVFAQGKSSGMYSCCGQPAQRGPSQRPVPQSGCAFQPHTPLQAPEAPIHHLDPGSAFCGTRLADSEGAAPAVSKPAHVQVLLRHQGLIVRQPGETKQELKHARRVPEAEEDQARPCSNQQEGEKATKPQQFMIEEEDDEDDKADSQQLMPGGQAQAAGPMRPLLGSTADPLHPSSLVLLAGLKPASPKLQKAVWQDLIREDDARQMDVLIAKLDSMRAQKAPDTKPAKPARKDQSVLKASMSRSSSRTGRSESAMPAQPALLKSKVAATAGHTRQRSCSVDRRRATPTC